MAPTASGQYWSAAHFPQNRLIYPLPGIEVGTTLQQFQHREQSPMERPVFNRGHHVDHARQKRRFASGAQIGFQIMERGGSGAPRELAVRWNARCCRSSCCQDFHPAPELVFCSQAQQRLLLTSQAQQIFRFKRDFKLGTWIGDLLRHVTHKRDVADKVDVIVRTTRQSTAVQPHFDRFGRTPPKTLPDGCAARSTRHALKFCSDWLLSDRAAADCRILLV